MPKFKKQNLKPEYKAPKVRTLAPAPEKSFVKVGLTPVEIRKGSGKCRKVPLEHLCYSFPGKFPCEIHVIAAGRKTAPVFRENPSMWRGYVGGDKGTLQLRVYQTNAGKFASVYRAVPPAWQGAGIGTALLRAAEEVARRNGIRHLGGTTGKDNKLARRTYEKLGWKVVAEGNENVTYAWTRPEK